MSRLHRRLRVELTRLELVAGPVRPSHFLPFSAYGRFVAFFTSADQTPKCSNGSRLPGRLALGGRQLFARSGRPVPTYCLSIGVQNWL